MAIITNKPSYEQLEAELAKARTKSADRKRALRNANTLIQNLQIRNSNLSWKAKMWEMRFLKLKYRNNKPWWKLF